MRVTKRGGARMRLDPGEGAVLLGLLDELGVVVADTDADDPVRERLYPAAYADETAAEEYRRFTEQSLLDERRTRIRECADDIAQHAPDIPLDDAAGDRWIRVLNDMRLALGTRLGITDDYDHDVDPTDPEQAPYLTYVWLTAVQDSLVRALM